MCEDNFETAAEVYVETKCGIATVSLCFAEIENCVCFVLYKRSGQRNEQKRRDDKMKKL
jgi:hypothetical protein